MKKIFKTLAVAIIAVTAILACVFAVGCNGNTDGAADYNFTIVYENGTAVNGQKDGDTHNGKVFLQICTTQCVDLVDKDIYPDENGKVSFTQKQINDFYGSATDITEFEFHVQQVKGCTPDFVFKVNGKGDYIVTVK